ncbi:unnamed protein product [Cylindrotheca closterium]|uniref:non-specific serine/threonine protein kinase n=1 Tax=Cylindrotheca closterium TaxID=2856 RepID=A0AAD2JP62_9STRA|nr:unnamed protein product [Cylindrotheca closterium]
MFHRAGLYSKSTGSPNNNKHKNSNNSGAIQNDSEAASDQISKKSKKRQCVHRINGTLLRLRQSFANTAPLCKAMYSCLFIIIGISVLILSSPAISFKRITHGMTRSRQQVYSNYHFHQPRMLQLIIDGDGDGDGDGGTSSSSNLYHYGKVQTTALNNHDNLSKTIQGSSKNKHHHHHHHHHRLIDGEATSKKSKKEKGASSALYKARQRDPLHEGDCEPMRWWQETSFPSCNIMHEKHFEREVAWLTNGGYNSIFRTVDNSSMEGGTTTYILKILQYETPHTDRNFDRVRRDSLLMERGTASKYIMNIYSYCGFTQIVEFGRHGNLDDILWKAYDSVTQPQKLQIATQVAQALADVHDLDGDGISSMSHGDFASKQYILIDGILKLNDFNRGRFIRWNPKLKESCTYTIGVNDGKFRAPEEYQYVPETAAIDIWALGSIFVELVTGYEVWYGYQTEEAQKRIAKGKLPSYQKRIQNKTDPINEILVKAIAMCWVYEPKDRPKAGVVADYLKGEAKRLGIAWEKSILSAK